MKRWTPALLAALALGLGACGGDDDDGGDSGRELTPAGKRFAQQADDVCKDANDRIEELGKPQEPDAFAAAGEKANDIRAERLEKLRALQPPPELKADWTKSLGYLEENLEHSRGFVAALKKDDTQGAKEALEKASSPGREQRKLAADLNMKACASI